MNSSGDVNAIHPGETWISVSTLDGTVTSSILVTVNEQESEFSIPTGYKELETLKINGNDFYLQVKFTVEINPDSIDEETVYILNRHGRKLEVNYQFESNDEKLNVITPSDKYDIGKPYYLFVEKGVTSKRGSPITQPIMTQFMWNEETGVLQLGELSTDPH